MSCGREYAPAFDIEKDGFLYAFEAKMKTPPHDRSLKLLRCWRQHRREFLITVPGQSYDATRARELDEQSRKELDQEQTFLLTENAHSVCASWAIFAP